jgi:hypothetical protein
MVTAMLTVAVPLVARVGGQACRTFGLPGCTAAAESGAVAASLRRPDRIVIFTRLAGTPKVILIALLKISRTISGS